jgi:hypothetical protein
VIHYHGGPVTPTSAAVALWTRRHGLASFERPDQVSLMAEVCQSFILDNGAFSLWRNGGGEVDVDAYAAWVRQWQRHPGFDFAIIPDVIDGSEADNAKMRARWLQQLPRMAPGGVVWHLHESIDSLRYLMRCTQSGIYRCVCLGSSGQWSTPGTPDWWERMAEVMDAVCDEEGRPKVRLHGLRMLNPAICSRIPLASADSANVARNTGIDKRWTGAYPPVTDGMRALVLAERIEHHVAAARWVKPDPSKQVDLFGLMGDAA